MQSLQTTLLKSLIPGKYSISTFDRFDDRVVFAKIEPDSEVTSPVQRLREKLEQIPGIPKDKHFAWKPHATVAFRLQPEEITKIWDYVLTLEKPNFTALFGNITIFRFDNEKWLVEKIFKINT